MKIKKEYTIYEAVEYYEKKVEKLSKSLLKRHAEGTITSDKAREKLDMNLCILSYLKACRLMADQEAYMNDNKFSSHVLYKLADQTDKKLSAAARKIAAR